MLLSSSSILSSCVVDSPVATLMWSQLCWPENHWYSLGSGPGPSPVQTGYLCTRRSTPSSTSCCTSRRSSTPTTAVGNLPHKSRTVVPYVKLAMKL